MIFGFSKWAAICRRNFHVINFRVLKHFRGLGYPRKYFYGINYVPRFSDLERDYARQKNVENEQLAAFVATTQLLANYSHVKEN